MPDLPPFIHATDQIEWEVLFQIYEFEQYREYADELTANEVSFVEQALGLNDDAAILDLACGAGRHAVELARRGYAVEGVELVAPLVAYAERCAYEEALRARFVQADMRTLTYQNQFDAVLLMNSSLGFFDDAANRTVLQQCAAALVEGGKVLLQCINPYRVGEYLTHFRSGWSDLAGGYLLRAAHFEPRTARLHMNYRYLLPAHGVDAEHPGDQIRLYGYPELEALLVESGLRPVAVFGDATVPAVPFEESSQWQVLVAERVTEHTEGDSREQGAGDRGQE